MQGDKKWARIDIFFPKIFSIPGLWVVQTWPYAFLKILEKKKNCSIEILEKYFDRFSICKYTCVSIHGSWYRRTWLHTIHLYNNNKSFIDEDFSYDFQSWTICFPLSHLPPRPDPLPPPPLWNTIYGLWVMVGTNQQKNPHFDWGSYWMSFLPLVQAGLAVFSSPSPLPLQS